MIPILFDSVTEGVTPSSYGIGALSACLSAEIIEERNGKYELTLTYPATGIHAEEIQPNRFIKAKPNYTDAPQLFRIYRVSKVMAGKFTVNAQHISYDLSGKLITSGTAGSAAAACLLLEAEAGAFTITTDINKSGAFKITEPSSVRSWFGGKAGSLVDLFGGEWHYNNYSAELKSARGENRGVTIRYGKNLTELSEQISMANLCTAILPFYIDPNGAVTLGSKVNTGLSLDVPREVAIDFSSEVDPESSTPIATQLTNLATAYKNNNNLVTMADSITLNFVQTDKLTERVDLCDTVSIYFEALGVTASAKCIATTWNVLKERYTKTQFGSARNSIADTIASNTKKVEESASRAFVNESSQLITGNKGGYVILHDSDGDGKPDELLIMNTDNTATATQVWRFNKGGLGHGTSYAGPFNDIALTADGKINASRIVTGTLTANVIKAGVLSDSAGNSTIDMTNGTASLWTLSAKGSFRIKNGTSGKTLGIYFPYDAGGAFQLNDANEQGRANLFVNAAGSYLYLYEPDGTLLANLSTSNSGAGLVLNNTSGTKNIDIHSETNSGVISIENAAGKSVVHGWGNPGGWFQVRDGTGNTTIELNGNNGQIICVSVHQTSSRKVKDNIKPLESEEAAKILELEPVSFDYKNKELGTNKRGFIAEDVAEVLPNLVTPEEGERTASLDYIGMIPYLVGVVKEQNERIKALEKKLNELGG